MTLVTSEGAWGSARFPDRPRGKSPLVEILAKPHAVKPWIDSTSRGSTETHTSWGRIDVPGNAAVRWRGQFVLVNHSGHVHVIGADGELILDPEEDAALWFGWANL